MNEQVRQVAHQLRLFGVHAGFEQRALEASGKGLSHMEFLRLILEDEVINRKNRSAQALLARAKFRSPVDLEDWDMSSDRGITKQKLRELGGLSFYHALENLLIVGKTGQGKTHLSMAIGRKLCQENISAVFLPMNFMFEEVLAARASGKYLNYVRKLSQSKVLVFDDFGLRNYTHEEANVLVDILEDRHRKGSVIVTSQVDPKGWMKLFEDPVIAEAIVDRLLNPSQKIQLQGPTYREKLQSKLPAGKSVEKESLLK